MQVLPVRENERSLREGTSTRQIFQQKGWLALRSEHVRHLHTPGYIRRHRLQSQKLRTILDSLQHLLENQSLQPRRPCGRSCKGAVCRHAADTACWLTVFAQLLQGANVWNAEDDYWQVCGCRAGCVQGPPAQSSTRKPASVQAAVFRHSASSRVKHIQSRHSRKIRGSNHESPSVPKQRKDWCAPLPLMAKQRASIGYTP